MIARRIIFDIETGCLPEEDVRVLMQEFSAPKNYTDPAKIRANIEAQKREWIEGAALSALTGAVLCIGTLKEGIPHMLQHETEAVNLEDFWNIWRDDYGDQLKMVGFACRSFDIPFLVRRSWRHGVGVPKDALHLRFRDGGKLIDLQDEWQLNTGDPKKISLNTLAKFMGLGSKTGEAKDFHLLWNSDRPKAVAYLENDLRLTAALADKIL